MARHNVAKVGNYKNNEGWKRQKNEVDTIKKNDAGNELGVQALGTIKNALVVAKAN